MLKVVRVPVLDGFVLTAGEKQMCLGDKLCVRVGWRDVGVGGGEERIKGVRTYLRGWEETYIHLTNYFGTLLIIGTKKDD